MDPWIPAELLYDSGEEIDIRYDDILNFTKVRLLDTTQLSKRLDVSRQYINQLVDKEKLHPVSHLTNTQLFTMSEIERC